MPAPSDVTFTRPEVTKMQPRWTLVADCLEGSRAIKDKRATYLPQPNPEDTSEENRLRFNAYLERAVFYNVTGRTLAGLVGQAFTTEPELELDTLLEPLAEDCDGSGVGLVQQAKKALSHVLSFGRVGLFVDYPRTNRPATKAEQAAGDVRPVIRMALPWDVINWRTKMFGSRKKLALVVIRYSYEEPTEGDFEPACLNGYMVLRLSADQVYSFERWEETIAEGGASVFKVVDSTVPTTSTGKPFDTIPFAFVGSENNDVELDLPPLYDLAELNVAHYRNSADNEEASYMVGQPTPVFSGLTESWVKQVMKGKVSLGSRGGVCLPEGGSAMLLQAAPNTMPKDGMEHKERQMVGLGAKLVEQKSVQRTAKEAGMDEASEVSTLSSAVKNVNRAYNTALDFCCLYAGADPEGTSFEISTEFQVNKMDSAERAQLVAEWQAGAVSFEELRGNLKASGIAWEDDEEVKAKVTEEGVGAPGGFGAPPVEPDPAKKPGDEA